jgi:hypothetical protein
MGDGKENGGVDDTGIEFDPQLFGDVKKVLEGDGSVLIAAFKVHHALTCACWFKFD